MDAPKAKANTEGYNMLARVMQERMKMVSYTPETVDFGVIQSDYSLKLNQYPIPIPPEEYFVCRHLTLKKTGGTLTTTIGGDGLHNHGSSGTHGGHMGGDGSHTHTNEGPHIHKVIVPETMRGLEPGDTVIAVWVGADPVVIDLIRPAKEVIG